MIFESTMSQLFRLFTDDCVIYRKIVNNNDIEKLQIELCILGDWAVENGMKINPGKSKVVSFMRAWVRDLLNYSLMDQVIPEASSCRYSGIILHSYLSSTNHDNYRAKKPWKALHFTKHILKNGNSNMKSLSYTALVQPILEYMAACWDPFWKEQINASDWVQKKVAKFANPTNNSNWETAQCREIAHICALYKAYSENLLGRL